ncbi:MAG: hypothetical protein HY053_05410, partial [Proteobacteria bacterium]|nr:hypothetical protein [Pseudomonadota bacterium]
YHRGYQTALSNMVEMQSNSFRAEDVVFNFDRPEARQELKVGDRFSVGFISESGSDSRLTSEQPRDPSDSRVNVRAFVVTDSITDATSASLHYKDPNALALGFSESDRTRMDRGLVKSNLQNPYAAFAATDGYASIIETPGFGGTVRVAGFFGHEGGRQKADARNFGSQAELAYKLDSSSKISLAFGALFENGSVLGTVGSGAFKLGNGTMTMYSGIGGSYQLDAKTTLRGAMYAGWTKPSLANDSLITGMSNLITTAFNMGIERRELAQKGDVFSFSVAQPLRVENGSMQFNLPYARDDVSDVVYSTNLTQDMGSKGREIDLEAVYAFPVEDDTSLSFGGVYRHDAGHVAGKEDVLGVLRVTRKF